MKTTLQMIADESNLSLNLLRYHFPKKISILEYITSQFLAQIQAFVNDHVENDALMKYMLFVKLYFTSLAKDAVAEEISYNVIMKIRDEPTSTGIFDGMYMDIIHQFNLPVSAYQFSIRKVQIAGAHTALTVSTANNLLKIPNAQRLEETIYVVCAMLGVSNYHYYTTLERMLKLYRNIDIPDFKFL